MRGLGRQSRNWGYKGTPRRTRDLLLLVRERGRGPFVRGRDPFLRSFMIDFGEAVDQIVITIICRLLRRRFPDLL